MKILLLVIQSAEQHIYTHIHVNIKCTIINLYEAYLSSGRIVGCKHVRQKTILFFTQTHVISLNYFFCKAVEIANHWLCYTFLKWLCFNQTLIVDDSIDYNIFFGELNIYTENRTSRNVWNILHVSVWWIRMCVNIYIYYIFIASPVDSWIYAHNNKLYIYSFL